MENCPHCQFLVRDNARNCTVCNKSIRRDDPLGVRAGQQNPQALAGHVGPAEAGVPVSVTLLFIIGLTMAGAVYLSTQFWI